MPTKIVVAGANGNLGTRIVAALNGQVTALVRAGADTGKLRALNAQIVVVDLTKASEIATACEGASVVVSAVQGLRDVIVDMQSALLEGALAAGVKRFIPSDFSTDFTKVPPGENRNFDIRREFQQRLDRSGLAATSILNGAFAELLTYNMPLLDLKKHSVGYWDDADWAIDFTTMDDTAAFTAAAALDATTPRMLRIASFQVTPRALAETASEVLGTPFELVNLGTRDGLREANQKARAANPEGENEVFPRWQQSQYMHSMFTAHHDTLDNGRYPSVAWTSLETVLGSAKQRR